MRWSHGRSGRLAWRCDWNVEIVELTVELGVVGLVVDVLVGLIVGVVVGLVVGVFVGLVVGVVVGLVVGVVVGIIVGEAG